MSHLTYRQNLYANYLLKRIGFQHTDLIEKYISRLEKIYGKWDTYENYHGYDVPFYNVSGCIDVLREEIELKNQTAQIELKSFTQELIAATDLSNFVYCPISYSIDKSFIIECPTGEELTEYGRTLYEQLRLVNKIIPYSEKETEVHRLKVFNNELVKKIRSSELIFTGHSDKDVFINKEEKFIGQPDYIFKDENGKFFAVEEKFHYLKSEHHQSWENSEKSYNKTINTFYDNHKVQLTSYIRNITEYKIEYGYLIYWFYELNEHRDERRIPQIHDVSIKKMTLTPNHVSLYNDAVAGIVNLHNNQGNVHFDFDVNKININKCVGCVVNKYCTHKSGRYNTYKFPHQRNHLTLFYTEFPDDLRNNN